MEGRRAARLHDPGAELLDKASGLWERYGRIGAIVVGALAVIAAGTFFTLRARAQSQAQAAAKIAEAQLLYWQGNYPGSLALAKQVYEQFPSTPSGLDARRLAGDAHYWNGDFKGAAAEYEAYLGKDRSGVLADAVRRSLAYAYESSGKPLEAARIYQELVGKFDRESSAEFLTAAARCYRNAGRRDDAMKPLKRLVDEFGDTSHGDVARIQLAELEYAAKR